MIEQNIQFKIKDDLGNDVNCFILASNPIDETEANVIYKKDNDEDDVLRYGKIVKTEEKYELKKDITEEEIVELKHSLDDEIHSMSSIIMNNVVNYNEI